VDITTTVERKLAALRCHQSQIEATHYDEASLGLARYRGVMSFSSTYAEVLKCCAPPWASLKGSLDTGASRPQAPHGPGWTPPKLALPWLALQAACVVGTSAATPSAAEPRR
jgi:hypothetical protein